MLFKDNPTQQENKKANRVDRPDRNKREKETQATEELSRVDVLELMGVNDRGFKRHRGAWRKV